MSSIAKVAGVDGCKNGWAVVEINLGSGEARVRVVARVEELLECPELRVIVVDIPIGFPCIAKTGGRACESEARNALGKGQTSRVFSSPARPALDAENYNQAREANRKHHACGKGISRQCFCLFPKMREVDALMPDAQGRIVECHPELCFWAMNNQKPIEESKKTPAGRKVRTDILKRNGFADSFLRGPMPRKNEIVAKRDDFLDACAAAWTACRIARGQAEVMPRDGGPKDAKGVKMEMWL